MKIEILLLYITFLINFSVFVMTLKEKNIIEILSLLNSFLSALTLIFVII